MQNKEETVKETVNTRKSKRCSVCNGIGFVKRKPSICKSCSMLTIKNCMYCENTNKGLYEECFNCIGTGSINIK